MKFSILLEEKQDQILLVNINLDKAHRQRWKVP